LASAACSCEAQTIKKGGLRRFVRSAPHMMGMIAAQLLATAIWRHAPTDALR
jgi:hypothetical protein